MKVLGEEKEKFQSVNPFQGEDAVTVFFQGVRTLVSNKDKGLQVYYLLSCCRRIVWLCLTILGVGA